MGEGWGRGGGGGVDRRGLGGVYHPWCNSIPWKPLHLLLEHARYTHPPGHSSKIKAFFIKPLLCFADVDHFLSLQIRTLEWV